jgi:hypothetical protein
MAKEWIENLAEDTKQKSHEAAENYGRAQHYAGVIEASGREFFLGLVMDLKENVDAFRRQLQGDPTSAETSLETVKVDEIKITRARFPWVDARLVHKDDTITLDYAKGPGVEGDPRLEREIRCFAFRVASDDTLFVEDAFADAPRRYLRPEELSRHITETLFAV